jgi:hypothetical protein
MRPKTKNRILKTITTAAVITLLLSACCLDGENVIIPLALGGVALAWIAIFAAANGER